MEEGIALIEEALNHACKLPGDVPFQLSWILPHLAERYDRAGLYAKSEPINRQFLADAKKEFGLNDPRTAGQMATLGLNLLKQQKWGDAELLLRECLLTREKIAPDAWTTFNAKSMLGDSLLGQENYADAEPLLLDGYEGMHAREEIIPTVAKIRLAEALGRLVRLYEATGDKDRAEVWRKKLAETTAAEGTTKP
jgi:hypothetical protein